MHLQLGRLVFDTTVGIRIRTGRHEVFVDRAPGPGRVDCWRHQGALYVRLGRYELVANPMPYTLPTAGAAAGE
ncbi:hypothetical protein [Ferrovibrio sp.]|uniref:hypothetical protein n=1 Tax=Ferrovibrio sp. TaxID=1917215 RepID=UPI00311E446E